jgi:hypothetical protein
MPPDTSLLFIPVPERKRVRDRIHIDLIPIVRSRDGEVTRLLATGASLVRDYEGPAVAAE